MSEEHAGERMPQRFRYFLGGRIRFGVCYPCAQPFDGLWNVECHGAGFSYLTPEPAPEIRQIIGDVASFEWIDNDYGWPQP